MKLQLSDVLVISQQISADQITNFRWISHQITDASILSSCINLISLDLSQNQLTDLLFVQFLPKLTSLQLDFNAISSLSVFGKTDSAGDSIFKLETLSIKANKIAQIQQIRSLGKISTLKTVNIAGNDCCNDLNFLQYALAMLPNCITLNEKIVRSENGDLIDLEGFIDQLPGQITEEPVENWLPESAFELIEMPGFNEICIELEQAVRGSIEKFYQQEVGK